MIQNLQKELRWTHYLAVYSGLAIVIVLIYHRALHIAWLEDDYQWLFVNPKEILFGCFFHTIGPDNHWYRPFMAMMLAFFQIFWGSSTVPIHVFLILGHAALGLLIYYVLRKFEVSFVPAFATTIYFAIAQGSSFVVMSNDTISQWGNSTFGAVSLWLLYRADLAGGIRTSWKYILASLPVFMFALFSKETSAGLIIALGLLLLLKQPMTESFPKRIGRALMWLSSYLLCMGIYLVLRASAGATPPNFSNGVYGFHFGSNIFKNIAMFAGQSLMPVSTLAIMKALYYKQRLLLGLYGIIFLAFAWVVLYGIVKSGRGRMALALAAIASCTLVPAIFLPHVSEAYLYNALPFITVIIGFSIEYYWQSRLAFKPAIGLAVTFVFLIAYCISGLGSIEKTNAMRLDADHSEILLPQIRPRVAALPPNGYLYLVHPQAEAFEYSVFTERGFRILNCTDLWLERWTHRPDVSIEILDKNEYLDSARIHPGTALTYDPQTMLVHPLD